MPNARRLLEAYDDDVRVRLRIAPDRAEDPVALREAAAALPEPARRLLDTLLLVAPAGDAVPDRLRDRITADGETLWLAGLLLPRANVSPGATLRPFHYAGACRLNPALRDHRPLAALPSPEHRATFPASDTRWDAIVVAAAAEAAPLALTQDGGIRRDTERRLYAALGDGEDRDGRWALALRYARLSGLLRVSGGRLHGHPEAPVRPIADPAALCADAETAAAASLLLRVAEAHWLPVPELLETLHVRCREILTSPHGGRYPGHAEVVFDDAGWTRMEAQWLGDALDLLHRVGALDVAWSNHQPAAFRRPGPRPSLPEGFLLASDGEILVHVGELRPEDYGRLARLAPFVEGTALRRHRLGREGVAQDIAAGHTDALEFLGRLSRTGVPDHVADLMRGWAQGARRIVVVTGADVIEDDDGRLHLGPPPPGAPVLDYRTAPNGRFVADRGRLVVPAAQADLLLRALLGRVAREAEREEGHRVWIPEPRPQAQPDALLARLREAGGGDLPPALEAMVRAGAGAPAHSERVHLVRLPGGMLGAVLRDPDVRPLVRGALGADEVVVDDGALAAFRACLSARGVRWVDDP